MKGVIGIVKLPTGLAVVADHFETAKAGRDALKVTWSKAKADGFSSDKALEDYVRIHADPNAQAAKLEEKGDVKAAFAGAAKTYQCRVPQRLRLSRADGAAQRGGSHQRCRRQGRGMGGQPGAG